MMIPVKYDAFRTIFDSASLIHVHGCSKAANFSKTTISSSALPHSLIMSER